jgi:hypothetical protein
MRKCAVLYTATDICYVMFHVEQTQEHILATDVHADWWGTQTLKGCVIGITWLITLGGGESIMVVGTLIYKEVKHRFFIFVCLHHPNNRSENIYIFLCCLQRLKKLFLGRKILEGHFPPPPPKLRLCNVLHGIGLLLCKT